MEMLVFGGGKSSKKPDDGRSYGGGKDETDEGGDEPVDLQGKARRKAVRSLATALGCDMGSVDLGAAEKALSQYMKACEPDADDTEDASEDGE